MARSSVSSWSADLANRHFERSALASPPFVAVTVLAAVCLVREAWILWARWPAPPPGGFALFAALTAMTPLPWLKGLLRHRQLRRQVWTPGPPGRGPLSPAGEAAADYVYTAAIGYLLLSIALGLVPR